MCLFGDNLPLHVAIEMATVGIVPCEPDDYEIGETMMLGAQPAKVIGEATKAEFLARVVEVGFPVYAFADLPGRLQFLRISVD